MRLVHTSDWHLGHRLHGASREVEHSRFLSWLLDRIAEHAADALLIAGDVFDTASPPSSALEQWYRFLRDARLRFPGLDIVVIGGNHDSAARLEAPLPLLRAIGVHMVGGLVARGGADDVERCLVPVTDASGAIGAWVAAVPFLRPPDLPRAGDGDNPPMDPLIGGVRDVYARVLGEASSRAGDTAAVVAMGHCYMSGTELSELSERRILGGNQHALPLDVLPESVTYGALGHLHKAQRVGRDSVRYSGSPIPLSIAERSYAHQVVLVELDGPRLVGTTSLRVPRTVDFLRIPESGAEPIDAVLAALAALEVAPRDDDLPPPFLEVAVRLERPEPTLRRRVDEALVGRDVRLARIVTEYTGHGRALGDDSALRSLSDLHVEDVFTSLWQRDHEGSPPADLVDALHELLDGLQADLAESAQSGAA